MITMLAELPANEGLQNVFTPFPFGMHLGFCIIATLLYAAQYYRKGSPHYLLLMFAADITFLTQTELCGRDGFITALGAAEAVLLTASIVTYIFYSKKLRAERAADEAEENEQEERRKEAEAAQAKLDRDYVENAFEDNE